MKAKIALLVVFIICTLSSLRAQVVATTDNYSTNANTILNGSSVLNNDFTTLGGNLVAQPFLNPVNGTLLIHMDGTFTYTPNLGFSGIETMGYIACDSMICDTAYLIVQVLPCVAPIADAGPDKIICGASASIIANTPIGGTGTWTIVSGPGGIIADPHNPILLFTAQPGNYTLRWTIDNPPCASSSDDVFISLNQVLVQVSSVPSSCGQCNGMAIATSIGGSQPYMYTWIGASGTSPQLTNVCAGVYTVSVMDANGCIANAAVTVLNSGNLSMVIDSVHTDTCGGANTGAIYAHPVGGHGPYSYTLNGVASGPSFTGLPAGIHVISITDSSGCIAYLSVNINQSSSGLGIVLDTLININCSGSNTGSIVVHATGGVGQYTYLWSPGNSAGPSINNLAAGIYTVTVLDTSACPVSQSYTISYHNNLYVMASSTASNCLPNGTATAMAFGGHPPYTYAWSDSMHQQTATATNLSGGTYSVLVTDSTGCQKTGSVFVNSTCLNVIKGRIYSDLNGNCIQDSGEPGIYGKYISATPGYSYAYSDSNGNYTLYVVPQNITVTAHSYTYGCNGFTPTCPTNGILTVSLSQPGDTSYNNNFAYAPPNGNFDFTLHPGWNSASPGFSKHYWICYYNHGPNTQNAVITFIYDSALLYNSSTQGGVHYPAQHKIEWTINNLPPSNGWNWSTKPEAFFTIPASFGIHDSLCSYFEISPSSGDCYPADNTLSRCEPVTGSLDPNDKAVYPLGLGANGNILASDSLLTYTIRFQNTGNDTAFTVVVIDTLSPFLNPATIVPGAASHPYTFDLSGPGVMTFRFDHILLPDSNVNLDGSNGYFTYTVRQKSNNPIGTVIANTAYIYFDFNPAVVTNTVINTIYSTVGMQENLGNSVVRVYPNPFKDETNFYINSTNNNEIYAFELQDVMGKKLRSFEKLTEKHFSVSRAGLSNGVYFYKIYSKSGIIAIGKLVLE